MGFLCLALEPVLELILYTSLALNSQGSACLLNSGIKCVHHHCQAILIFNYIFGVSLYVFLGSYMWHGVPVEVRGQLVELVLSFYHVGCGD